MAKEIPDHYLQLGRLGKTFQLAGGLRFYPLGDAEAEAIFELEHVFVEGFGLTDVRNVRMVSKDIVVYLSAALVIEDAKPLVNRLVFVEPNDLPDSDAVYLDELIGLTVFLEGESFGSVESVIEAGLQDILTIATSQGDVMIPLQAPYVEMTDRGIDLKDVPEGLLDLNSD